MLAGSKTARMIVASIKTAAARPTPNCFSLSASRVQSPRLRVYDGPNSGNTGEVRCYE